MASAKSWTSRSSKASRPDLALKSSRPSRRSSASSAERFSSISSTSRNLTASVEVMDTFLFHWPQSACPIDTLRIGEIGEVFGMRGKAQALFRAQTQKAAAYKRRSEEHTSEL